MNEIDGFSVLLTFPKPKANRSRKRRQFDDFSLLQGVASLRPIHSYKTACTTTRICSMCFAREENAITRKSQNQKHCPSIRRNMQALPPREEWPCCNGATKTDWKNLAGTQAKVQGLQKGARQLKSRKPLRKTQGQASFLDRRVRNMENRRGPLNRRIRRYSILQQLNFGDTSCKYTIQGSYGSCLVTSFWSDMIWLKNFTVDTSRQPKGICTRLQTALSTADVTWLWKRETGNGSSETLHRFTINIELDNSMMGQWWVFK